MPQPTKIPRAFADSGDKNAIPDSSGSPGFASWREGFPQITSEPFANGGIAPKRADFNGIFNALSLATVWLQQGGVYEYDNLTDYEVGNLVEYSGDIYLCLVVNGPNSAVKAPTDATVWSKVFTSNAGTLNGNVTFSQSGAYIQKTTDSGTMAIYSGSAINKGAELVLYGKDNSSQPGQFSLRAKDGANTKILLGKPDGSLTWNGDDVFSAGNCTISSSTASMPYKYKMKFANGAMIQGYYDQPTTDSNSRITWTYDEAFLEDPFPVVGNGEPNQHINLHSWNKTRTILRVNDLSGTPVGNGVATEVVIVAIGRWK